MIKLRRIMIETILLVCINNIASSESRNKIKFNLKRLNYG